MIAEQTTDLTMRQVLDLPMPQPNDAGAGTFRDYLVALLLTLWAEGEGFSGKRPLGNSGWEHDLRDVLIEAGAADDDTADQLVTRAIQALRAPEPVGYMVVRPGDPKDSEPDREGLGLAADWDGDVHPDLRTALAELPTANDGDWGYRVVALVDLDGPPADRGAS